MRHKYLYMAHKVVNSCFIAYLEDKLIPVLHVVGAGPRQLGGGHLYDDTPNTPNITLPAIPTSKPIFLRTTPYHLRREGGRGEGERGRDR